MRVSTLIPWPAVATELRELLRHSPDGTVAGPEFLTRVAQWLRQFLVRHAEDVVAPQRMPAVERARAYLENRPTESVTCGFADQSHLSRRFKECHGVTPGAFQAQYLGAVESPAA